MALKIATDLRDVMREFFYPIGALFISKNNTNPNSIMGGTWVAVTDDYLLNFITSGTGGSYGGNSNSATDSTVLSVAQMPSHTHIQNAHGHDAIYVGDRNSPYKQVGGNYVPTTGFSDLDGRGWTNSGTMAAIAQNQYTGGGSGHTHPLTLKKLNMYGWIRTA